MELHLCADEKVRHPALPSRWLNKTAFICCCAVQKIKPRGQTINKHIFMEAAVLEKRSALIEVDSLLSAVQLHVCVYPGKGC